MLIRSPQWSVRAALIPVISVGLVFLLAVPVGAEEPEPDDMTAGDLLGVTVQIASVEGADLLSLPSNVTVIDSAMIREFNLQSVAEAVDLVAGFMVMRTYIKRDLPTGRGVIQDQYANKVLVMINNVPTWLSVTGEGALARIDIHDVDRIEVLKGPASVLYGTNAYAGAINIVLKEPGAYRSEVQLGVFEDYGFTAGGNVTASIGGFETMIAANSVNAPAGTVDFTDEVGVTGEVDEQMTRRTFSLVGRRGSHSLLVNAYDAEESFLGTLPRYSGGAGRDHQLRGTLFNYTWAGIARGVGLYLAATYDWNERDFSRSGDDVERSLVQGYRLQGTAKAVVALAPGVKLQGGLEVEQRTSQRYENYNSRTGATLADNRMEDRTVDEQSLFVQLDLSRGRFSFVPGVRYTDNELFGDNVSARAAAVYRMTDSSSLKLMAGQSYRVPSLFELYFQTPTNTVFGNTELEPETNDTIELAWVGSHRGLFFEALVYHAEYDKKIYRERRYPIFTDDPTDTSTVYVNGGAFSADGLELSLRYRRSGALTAFASYAFVDGDNGDEVGGNGHYNFRYVPQHTLAAGATRYFGPTWVTGVVHYLSTMDGPHEPISGQTTFDLTLGYAHRIEGLVVRHLLSAKNAADDVVMFPEYVRRGLNEIPSGYGRRVSYTVQVAF